jgi:hypothetical protein
VFYEAGQAMKCKQNKGAKNKNVINSNSKPWYDDECKRLNRDRSSALNCFRRSNSQRDLDMYLTNKRLYKNTFRRKRNAHTQDQCNMLHNSIRTKQDLWNVFSKLKPKSSAGDLIGPADWFNYFKSLFAFDTSVDQNVIDYCMHESNLESSSLNNQITDNEVISAISHLKNGKSAGIDGIPGEMFKCCSTILVPVITNIFNSIFQHVKNS